MIVISHPPPRIIPMDTHSQHTHTFTQPHPHTMHMHPRTHTHSHIIHTLPSKAIFFMHVVIAVLLNKRSKFWKFMFFKFDGLDGLHPYIGFVLSRPVYKDLLPDVFCPFSWCSSICLPAYFLWSLYSEVGGNWPSSQVFLLLLQKSEVSLKHYFLFLQS